MTIFFVQYLARMKKKCSTFAAQSRLEKCENCIKSRLEKCNNCTKSRLEKCNSNV